MTDDGAKTTRTRPAARRQLRTMAIRAAPMLAYALCYVFGIAIVNGCSDAPGGGGGIGKTDVLYEKRVGIDAIDAKGGINGRVYDTSDAVVSLDGSSADPSE